MIPPAITAVNKKKKSSTDEVTFKHAKSIRERKQDFDFLQVLYCNKNMKDCNNLKLICP